MKLKKLQNNFVNALYGESSEELLLSIKKGKLLKEESLDIYRNNLRETLINALRITYSEIHKNLGAKKFQKLCDEFIKKNRSRSSNLDDYGPEFNSGFCGEVERLKHHSYLARDAKPLNLKKLKKLPPEKLFEVKFKLHPACFLHKNLIIYRQDLEVRTEKISRAEMNFLRGVQENFSLYEIYEKHKINIRTCLQKYLANGVLSKFSTQYKKLGFTQ